MKGADEAKGVGQRICWRILGRKLTLPWPMTKGPVLCWPLFLAENFQH